MKYIKYFEDKDYSFNAGSYNIENWNMFNNSDIKDFFDLIFIDFISPTNGSVGADSNMSDGYGCGTYKLSIPKSLYNEDILESYFELAQMTLPHIRKRIIEEKDIIKIIIDNNEPRTVTIGKKNRFGGYPF